MLLEGRHLRAVSDGARAAAATVVAATASSSDVTVNQAWLLLAVTISLEVFATCCMKLAATNRLWQIGVGVGYVACFSVFPFVLQRIPLGVAYAIWSGMGTSATAAIR